MFLLTACLLCIWPLGLLFACLYLPLFLLVFFFVLHALGLLCGCAMAPTTWVHSLCRTELVDELAARALPVEGAFDVLRRRLRAFVADQPDTGMFGMRMVQRLPRRMQLVADTPSVSGLLVPPCSFTPPVTLCAAELTPLSSLPIGGGVTVDPVDHQRQNKLGITVVSDLIGKLPLVDGTHPPRLCDFLIMATGIMDLELVPYSSFVLLLVSRTTGSLSQDLIPLSRGRSSWDDFCRELIGATCPLLIREDLAMSHVSRRFQGPGESFDTFVNQIFLAARVLGYPGSEASLVDICIQNMLPTNRIHLTFSSKPSTRADLKAMGSTLANAIFLERVAANQTVPPLPGEAPVVQPVPTNVDRRALANTTTTISRGVRCWACGVWGHRKSECPTVSRAGCRLPPPSGNGRRAPR